MLAKRQQNAIATLRGGVIVILEVFIVQYVHSYIGCLLYPIGSPVSSQDNSAMLKHFTF